MVRDIRLPVAGAAILLLVAATLVLIMTPLRQVRPWGIDPADTFAIPASVEGLPFRLVEGVRPKTLGLSTAAGPYGLQLYHHFVIDPAWKGPPTVLLSMVSGDSRLFVNGVQVPGAHSRSERYLTIAGAGSRLWTPPEAFLRPGLNRIDLVIARASDRNLTGPILIGPAAPLTSVQTQLGGFVGLMRQLLEPILILASLLSLLAALTGKQWLPWTGFAAAAAAMAARMQLTDPTVAAGLDLWWPFASNFLLASALVCSGCAVLQPRNPEPPWVRWSLSAGAIAMVLSLAMALIYPRSVPGQVSATAALLPILGLGFALWSGWRVLGSSVEPPPSLQVMQGLAAGLLVAVALAGVGGALELVWGELAIAAEVSFGLGLAGLASGLAASAGSVAIVGAWSRLRRRSNLDRIIQRQQAEIAATATALQQQQRRSAILEERQRLARDMHDGIGGHLASLLARVRSRKISIDQMESELVGGLSELRLLVDSLDAAGESLAEAMASFRVRIRPQIEGAGMTLTWSQPDDLDIATSDPRWVLHLYRFMQEAVSNAVRHSGGDRLTVTVERLARDVVAVRIEDNGLGFDPETVSPGKGLSNLAFRAAQLGGRLVLARPGVGTGTVIEAKLRFPIPEGAPPWPGQSNGEIMPS